MRSIIAKSEKMTSILEAANTVHRLASAGLRYDGELFDAGVVTELVKSKQAPKDEPHRTVRLLTRKGLGLRSEAHLFSIEKPVQVNI